MNDQLEREQLAVESIPSRTQRDEEEHRAQPRHGLVVDALSTKPPADRTLFHGQLAVVPVPSREQLAVESIPSRTQRDEGEHRVQPRNDLVDPVPTKLPDDRTLFSDQLEVVPIPSRDQLAVESIPSRTQRGEDENRAQPRHDLVEALSTKPPADRALFHGQLAGVPVPSREQLAVESIPNRTPRDEEEHRVQPRHDLRSQTQ